ncbi:CREBZF [Mytilus edulis]|uniref:CREBZF n=1 Tax=Mytilus edulis TaxID=6550 RepID=A0A8S3SM19_MYTED|nr:CREBZF [Mytilus edulis]
MIGIFSHSFRKIQVSEQSIQDIEVEYIIYNRNIPVRKLPTIYDLMDTGIINVDINFGEQKDDALKKSPYHESDSGVSIMSSPQHSIISDFEDDISFKALSPPCFENFDNLLDTELTNYLASETDSNDATDFEIANIVSVSPVIPSNAAEYDRQVSNTSQDSDNDCQKRVLSKTTVAKPNPVITSDAKNNKFSTLPAVKVIKVITAPRTTSRFQIDKEIIEAIDEKNQKNAKQAKMNREKKKAYIKNLEDEVDSLQSQNANLNDKMGKLEHHKNALEEEVEYLKSVLANQSTLSNLLKNIPNANVKLTSSFRERKRSAAHDHDYQGKSKHCKKSKSAGVADTIENLKADRIPILQLFTIFVVNPVGEMFGAK